MDYKIDLSQKMRDFFFKGPLEGPPADFRAV